MSTQRYVELAKKAITPTIQLDIGDKDKKETTFLGAGKYMEANEELLEITNYIKANAEHNSDIEPSRIRCFYTTKPKKVGGKFAIGDLIVRSEFDKLVNDEIDYILIVYYQMWKELEIEDKVIQLDRLLCGVKAGGEKKELADAREYTDNLWFYQPDKVLRSVEKVALSITGIIEREKEARKNPPDAQDQIEQIDADADEVYES